MRSYCLVITTQATVSRVETVVTTKLHLEEQTGLQFVELQAVSFNGSTEADEQPPLANHPAHIRLEKLRRPVCRMIVDDDDFVRTGREPADPFKEELADLSY